MISYVIQTLFFQLLFLIGYDIFHKKDTFFNINRFYLLVTSILSLVLPFIQIESIQEKIPEEYVVNLPTVFIGQAPQSDNITLTAVNTHTVDNIFENINWWLFIYAIGVGIMLFRFLKRLFKLQQLKKNTTYTTVDNYKLYHLPNCKDAFSFWNSVYLGNDINQNEKEQILTHELVHLQHKHSVDLLWFESLKIIFWFNPLVYLYQSRITALHEFIADFKSISILGKKQYYRQLLNIVFDNEDIEFINQFFSKSLIKKRIQMLQKSKSKNRAKMKYLLVIPSLCVMLVMASFSKLSKEFNPQTTQEVLPTQSESKFKTTKQQLNTNKNQNIVVIDTVNKKQKELPELAKKEKNEITTTKKTKDTEKKTVLSVEDLNDRAARHKTNRLQNLSDEDKKIVSRLEQIKKRIEEGETDFATQAILHSEDPGSKNNGGAYIVTKDAPFVKEFIKQAFTLKEGEISNPFKTNFGWHLLTVEKIDEEKRHVRHILIQKKTEFPFSVVEKTPATKNCDHLTDPDIRKECFTTEVSKFVVSNFNIQIAKDLGLTGVNRIYTRFKIDSLGNTTDIQVRAPLPQLEQETKRVIKLLPPVTPGEIKGKKVNVLFSLPIVFNIEPQEKSGKPKDKSNLVQEETVLSDKLSDIENNTVESGYYLVTNIFKRKSYFKKGIAKLKKQGLQPKHFKNPKDTYLYVYLKRFNTYQEAKEKLLSDYDGKYEGDLYILKIH